MEKWPTACSAGRHRKLPGSLTPKEAAAGAPHCASGPSRWPADERGTELLKVLFNPLVAVAYPANQLPPGFMTRTPYQ